MRPLTEGNASVSAHFSTSGKAVVKPRNYSMAAHHSGTGLEVYSREKLDLQGLVGVEQTIDVGMLARVGFGICRMFGINSQSQCCSFRRNRAELLGKPCINAQGARLTRLVFDAADEPAGHIGQFKRRQVIGARELREIVGEFFGEVGNRHGFGFDL